VERGIEGETPVESWVMEADGGARAGARGAEIVASPGVIDDTKAAAPNEAAEE
jgi:hypothetical protein